MRPRTHSSRSLAPLGRNVALPPDLGGHHAPKSARPSSAFQVDTPSSDEFACMISPGATNARRRSTLSRRWEVRSTPRPPPAQCKRPALAYRRLIMIYRVVTATLAASLFVGASFAESAAPSSEKPETSCTTSSAATSGSGDQKTSNSMAIEKSAILPDAGGVNSAAPTVQSGGKPMEVRSNCPPDSKPK